MYKQQARRLMAASCRAMPGRRPCGTILMYHSVSTNYAAGSLPPDLFARQLGCLVEHYSVISLEELVFRRLAKQRIPRRSVVITFDDGFADNYHQAFPMLRAHGVPAIVFVVTGFVAGRVDITSGWQWYRGLPALNWDQVREMQAGGVTFGAHTVTHPLLGGESPERLRGEVLGSKLELEDQIGRSVTCFAYPRGQRADVAGPIRAAVREAGFSAACSGLWGADNRRADLLALRRVRIDQFDTMADFRAKLRGAWDFVALWHRVRRS